MIGWKEAHVFLSSLHYAGNTEQGLGWAESEGHGERWGALYSWSSSMIGEQSSRAGSLHRSQGWEKGKEVLTPGPASPARSYYMFSVWDVIVPSFTVTSGNHFHLEAWVSHRKAGWNFSSLHLARTVKSAFWPLGNAITEEHADGCNTSKSKACGSDSIPTHAVRQRSHSCIQPVVGFWEDGRLLEALGTWSG